MKPFIGSMLLSDVKPLHCKMILNKMNDGYAGSTIRQAFICMGTMFKSALMNDLIIKHPMNGVRYTKPVRAPNDIKFLTIEEQQIFLETAKRSHNYKQYALLLETGLRTGELIGLTWDAIDFEKRTLTVNKTLEYRHKQGYWRAGPPKTQHSYRTIPLTNKAYDILLELYQNRKFRKESPTLSQTLEYMDRHTGQKSTLVMRDLVFINWRTGEPAKNSSYPQKFFHMFRTFQSSVFCEKRRGQNRAFLNFNYWGFTIRFTSLFFTRMVLTTFMPSTDLATFSTAMAASTTAASSLSAGTETVPFSLPLT